MSLIEDLSPIARAHWATYKLHLARLRELDARLAACQTPEAEDRVQQLIEAENRRWATVQQQPQKDTQ